MDCTMFSEPLQQMSEDADKLDQMIQRELWEASFTDVGQEQVDKTISKLRADSVKKILKRLSALEASWASWSFEARTTSDHINQKLFQDMRPRGGLALDCLLGLVLVPWLHKQGRNTATHEPSPLVMRGTRGF